MNRICDICGEDIEQAGSWLKGHNAAPVVVGGRCCGSCNASVVLPRRMAMLYNFEEEKGDE